jgi:hypothetical protein
MQRKAMKTRWIMGAAALAVFGTAEAEAQQQAAGDTLEVHVVRRGDTLWGLSRQYLRDPFRWPEIFRLNRDVVSNPDLIFPAERLRIPILAVADATRAPLPQEWVDAGMVQEDRTIFYAPEVESAAAQRLRLAQNSPAASVTRGDHLRAGLLVPESAISPVGRLVELISPSVVPLQIDPQIQLYDRVYMTIGQPGIEAGDRLHLLREGRVVRPYGRIFNTTGVATVEEIRGNVATVRIEEMYDVVAVGDAAVRMPEFDVRAGDRAASSTGIEGRIIAFQTPHALQNVEDIAFMDLGTASGVVEGDEFVAVIPEEQRSWGVRPEIEVARLRVVRATDRTAAARVVGLEQPALEPGLLVRLVAKMP